MDTTGVYTGEYFNTSFMESAILFLFTFIIIIFFIFRSYINKTPVYQKKYIEENSLNFFQQEIFVSNQEERVINPTFLDNFDLKQFGKSSANSILFLILGFLFTYGIGFGSEVIIGSWTENIGSLELKSIAILFILNLLVYPLLLIILFKIADYIIVVKQKIYLSILFISFSLGIAIYMHFYLEYYNKLFYIEDKFFYVIPLFLATLLNGFILGETYREGIDLNSKKRFFYIDEKGKKINHPPLRLLLRFGIFIFLILLSAIYGVANFYLFLKGNITNAVPYILSLSMLIILYAIKHTKKDFQIPDLNLNDRLSMEKYKKPTNLKELYHLLVNPDLIPYHEEDSYLLNNFSDALIHCMKDEGGVVLISGGKWTGKKRLVKEVLNNERFKHRTEFKISCTSKVENKFLPFIEGMKNIPQIESILENIKIGKSTKKATNILSGIFSVIPIAGGLISQFLESDIDLTSKENEKYILDTLSNTVQEISIELQNLSGKEGENRDQILFLLDNFQDIDESTLLVMEKIKEHLQNPLISPETNYVAFVLFLNNDSRFLNEDKFKSSELLQPYKSFHVHGLNEENALKYFREYLNFAPNRTNDELFTKIFDIYSEDSNIKTNKIKYISPKYILETIRFELIRDDNKFNNQEILNPDTTEVEKISIISGKFIYNGNPAKLHISDTVLRDYTYRIEKLNTLEIEILEVASIFGSEFNIIEISYILNIDSITISKRIKEIEKDGDILVRLDNSGEYAFKKGIYREIFKKRIFSSISIEGEIIPYQLFTEYCNRGVDFFKIKNLELLSFKEIKRYAHITFYASYKYTNEFISSNLEFSKKAYTVPELQIDGITSLEKIVLHPYFKDKDIILYLDSHLFLNKFISTLSYYINDFQQSISGSLNPLNSIIENLYNKKDYLINKGDFSLLNNLMIIFKFSNKPYNLDNEEFFALPQRFNQKALFYCKDESDIIIAKFWKSYLLREKWSEDSNNLVFISESIDISLEILLLIDKIKDLFWRKSYLSKVLNNLGQCYQIKFRYNKIQSDKERAIKFLNECISVKEEFKDYTGIAIALLTRASLQSDLQSKINDLNLGVDYYIKVKNYNGVAILYETLEKIMVENNNLEQALIFKNLKEETILFNRITT